MVRRKSDRPSEEKAGAAAMRIIGGIASGAIRWKETRDGAASRPFKRPAGEGAWFSLGLWLPGGVDADPPSPTPPHQPAIPNYKDVVRINTRSATGDTPRAGHVT